jgi:hypothetical protein
MIGRGENPGGGDRSGGDCIGSDQKPAFEASRKPYATDFPAQRDRPSPQ